MADDTPSTPNLRFPEWQVAYQAALLEVDPQKLPERVKAAEAAIFLRQQALANSSDGHAERQAIEDAVAGLRILKRDSLGFRLGKDVVTQRCDKPDFELC